MDTSDKAFICIVSAGLWNQPIELKQFGRLDYDVILRLAEEQSVIGLVTEGLELVQDVKVPQEVLLQFIGSTLQIEQRNIEMNSFIPKLIMKLQSEDIAAVLVKGQGVAQSYEKPLWRASGDVDLLLDNDNYEKARKVLFPIAHDVEQEDVLKKHQALKIKDFEVELHGRLPFSVSRKAQQVNDEVVIDSLKNGGVSVWQFNDKDVFIPNPNNHIYLVFTHYLQHFFIEGVGLRQICDWCRMLWEYRNEVDLRLLESRLRRSVLMSEWQVFGTQAVEYLGMPKDAMPFYDERYKKKGLMALKRVLKSGNFGHNNDLSYRTKYKGTTYKMVSLWRRFWDFAALIPVFPVDAPRFFVGYLNGKIKGIEA